MVWGPQLQKLPSAKLEEWPTNERIEQEWVKHTVKRNATSPDAARGNGSTPAPSPLGTRKNATKPDANGSWIPTRHGSLTST